MKKPTALLWLLPLLAAGSGLACGHSTNDATAEPAPAAAAAAGESPSAAGEAPAAGSEPPSAFAAPLPSHSPSAQAPEALPPGHPPLPATGPAGTLPPPSADSGSGAQGLVWSKPKGWTEEAPSSGMRRAQYRISGGKGEGSDAECVVYYFGPGQGGDAESNAARWADQFEQPDGRPSRDVMKRTPMAANGIPVLLVEVAGSYSGGMGSMPKAGVPQGKQLLLGAIASGPDANWFFKLLGPEATVRAQEGAFKAMIGSLKKGS